MPEKSYLVWSNEHSPWWGSNKADYYLSIKNAGRYTRDEALEICVGVRGGRREELLMTVWTEPGRCSSCRNCGMDMSMAPFCHHPEVLAKQKAAGDLPVGYGINRAIREFCGEDLRHRDQAQGGQQDVQ